MTEFTADRPAATEEAAAEREEILRRHHNRLCESEGTNWLPVEEDPQITAAVTHARQQRERHRAALLRARAGTLPLPVFLSDAAEHALSALRPGELDAVGKLIERLAVHLRLGSPVPVVPIPRSTATPPAPTRPPTPATASASSTASMVIPCQVQRVEIR
ncbi:hypothetical protein [Kitasatospora sp. NPDC088783]|uniref:hypothetical protein n=1 Tax=Kitasatospora sp. NPDC088783 TaxID=3364077 RepID=UPI00381DBC09